MPNYLVSARFSLVAIGLKVAAARQNFRCLSPPRYTRTGFDAQVARNCGCGPM